MITISLCMIVKNEEDVLARCLNCVKDAVDEIIVVDTGSTDATREIAARYTDRIFDFKWIEDFSAARNYAFSKATMDYQLWLDADDLISSEDVKNLKRLKEQMDPTIDVVMMKYCSTPDADGRVSLSYFRERMVKRNRNFKWLEPVHEYIEFYGKVLDINITIMHDKVKFSEPGRNLRIYENFIANGGALSTRGLFYYARELSGSGKSDEAAKTFREFLARKDGWVEDKISACNELAECCKAIGDEDGRVMSLLTSFRYDTPRAESCCGIGLHYIEKEEYQKAIFWFQLALGLEKPKNSWGFIYHDQWDFVPTIQLCVCYDKLGNLQEAFRYHRLSAALKPEHPSVLYNRKYFESRGMSDIPADTVSTPADSPHAPDQCPAPADSSASPTGSDFISEGPDSLLIGPSPYPIDLSKYSSGSPPVLSCSAAAPGAAGGDTDRVNPTPQFILRNAKPGNNRLTLSMLVHNEAGRFLEKVLQKHVQYIDAAVIIDDASTDDTIHVCCDILKGVPLHLVHNPVHGFANEIQLRRQQWEETLKTDPGWILCLDADEMFEDAFAGDVRQLIDQEAFDLVSFRLYDFWDDTHYREDRYWCAHQYARPFLIRPRKGLTYAWEETPQHCGRLPKNVFQLPNTVSPMRLKHLGWSKPQLRKEKYDRYMLLDPGAKYGIKEQYDSILDDNPNLVEWTE